MDSPSAWAPVSEAPPAANGWTAVDETPTKTPGTLDNQVAGFKRSVVNQAKGAFDLLSSVVDPHMAEKVGNAALDAQIDQWHQAKGEYAKGNYANALRRGLAAVTPLVGPMIENTAAKMTSGAPGAVTEGATDLALPFLVMKGIESGPEFAETVSDHVGNVVAAAKKGVNVAGAVAKDYATDPAIQEAALRTASPRVAAAVDLAKATAQRAATLRGKIADASARYDRSQPLPPSDRTPIWKGISAADEAAAAAPEPATPAGAPPTLPSGRVPGKPAFDVATGEMLTGGKSEGHFELPPKTAKPTAQAVDRVVSSQPLPVSPAPSLARPAIATPTPEPPPEAPPAAVPVPSPPSPPAPASPASAAPAPYPSKLITEGMIGEYARDNGLTEDSAAAALRDQGVNVITRGNANRMLHGIGSELGYDHDALSQIARSTYGSGLGKLSDAQMLELGEKLSNERATQEPLAKKRPQENIRAGNPATDERAARESAAAESAPGAPPEADFGGPRETTVLVPGGKAIPARYALAELGDIQASHNGVTFQPNPKFRSINDRDYSVRDNQAKILNGAGPEFNPRLHITDNPDATNGPPVVNRGDVLGGNGRTMMLQRVYASNPAGAAAYRSLLEQKAGQFGLDPAAVRAMKQPVLIREVPDGAIVNSQEAITDLNRTGTQSLRPAERAIADSRRVSQGTLDHVADLLQQKGPNATLNHVLAGESGTGILDKLINDGVVSPTERAGLASRDELSSAGKARISQLLLGRFFRDPAQLDTITPVVRGKLERLAAPLAQAEGVPGWSVTPDIQGALDILEEMRARDLGRAQRNVDMFLRYDTLEGTTHSPRSILLAKKLLNGKSVDLTAAAREYASYAKDAKDAADYGESLFGSAPAPEKTPTQAFDDAFAAKTKTSTPEAAGASELENQLQQSIDALKAGRARRTGKAKTLANEHPGKAAFEAARKP